jgi:hypothetical protein
MLRLTNGQRVTPSTVCETTFELDRHEFKRTFYVLRDLRVGDLVLGLPWLDDEEASLWFGTTRVFTQMDGTIEEIRTKNRRHECLLMSFLKAHAQHAPKLRTQR